MQVMSNGRVRRNESEWSAIISKWQKSGLKPRGFCRREQLQLSTFLRWQKKCQAGSEAPAPKAAEFIEVTAAPGRVAESSSWVLEIALPNGCELRFRG